MNKLFQTLAVVVTIALTFLFSYNSFAQDLHSVGRAPSIENLKGESGYNGGGKFVESTAGYGTDALALQWVQVPFPAGTPITPLGAVTEWLSGGDFGPSGIFYGIPYGTGASPFSLYQVNTSTGAYTLVSNSLTVNGTITSLAYYEATNTMYLGSTDITNSYLYTIDVNTGATTYIGQVTNCPGLISMGISCNGSLFAADIVNDNLVSINTSTGAGTIVGPLGVNLNYAQGADFDNTTGEFYLAAYNLGTSTGQFLKVNLTTGATTLIADWGNVEIDGFGLDATCGPPVGPGQATNPNPPSGAVNVPITLSQATWTNPSGATESKFYFGTSPGTLQLLQSGGLYSSFTIPPGTLQYYTKYYWRVDEVDGTGTTQGQLWSFTTQLDPAILFYDPYPDLSQWTVIGPLGLSNWSIFSGNNAGGTSPELRLSWTPSFNGDSYVLSTVIPTPNSHNLKLDFKHFLDFYADPSGVMGFKVTYNGGSTYTDLWSLNNPTGNVGPENISLNFQAPAGDAVNLQLAIFYSGNSFNIDYWFIDDVMLTDLDYIPVELTAFTGSSKDGNVELSWTTATETNNSGFEVERLTGTTYSKIGFVAGNGTTTQPHSYSFVDKGLDPGKYMYRLKQVDLDGSFAYSDVVEVEVTAPAVFALDQNYPNPFNPTTKINFSLASDAKVTLKVFNLLGQEIATLVNENMSAGRHSVNFNASLLTSGMYVYKIEATGNDGSTFSDVKKMLLTK
ncbi:MAG: T9SS type A sorting domain-containing protein [Ignavibacteriaceae bacterium]|nr:T9SS type A sorting domain-containing protein [Ignavibacteriaceae bacterium]